MSGHEERPSELLRMVRAGLLSGIVQDAMSLHIPRGLLLAVREGLSVRTVHALHAAHHPQRLAVVDSQRSVSYAAFESELNRTAFAMRDRLGLRSSSPVILMMSNRAEYLIFWFAAFRLGCPAVHASYRSTPEELAYLVEHSGAHAVICDSERFEVAEAARKRFPERELSVVVASEDTPAGAMSHQQLIAGMPDHFFRQQHPGSGDNVVYTSGTTGRPKGALRSWSSYGVAELLRLLERLPLRAGDRHLVVAPLYHSGAQVFVTLMCSLGGTLYLQPRFDAAETLEMLDAHDIHHVFMVPTMIQRLIGLDDAQWAGRELEALRALISGAANFPDGLRRRTIERLGAQRIFDFYGATELGFITLIQGDEMLERPGSVGRALIGHEIRIHDEHDAPLPAGEVGAIHVRDVQGVSGYLHDEQATASMGKGKGWLTVDDLGYLDDEGYLYLAGRARDMIISGGVNIYPAEIEQQLSHHDRIDEVAVIGLNHEEWGEQIVGVIVANGPLSAQELEAFLHERLASYKIPKRWEFVDALPRNPTGKILKRQLRQQLGDSA